MSGPTQAAMERVMEPVMEQGVEQVPESTHLATRVRALEQRYREIAATRMAGVALCHPDLEVAAVDFAPEPGGAAALGALVTPWFMNLVWLPLPGAADASASLPRGSSSAPPGTSPGTPSNEPSTATSIALSTTAANVPSTTPSSAPANMPSTTLPVGASRKRAVGPEIFEFIGAHESGIGGFEACSLFSPMFEFADQAAAVETARAVLRVLRTPAERPAEWTTDGVEPTTLHASPTARPNAKALVMAPGATNLPQPGPTPPVPGPAAPTPARRAFLLGRGSR